MDRRRAELVCIVALLECLDRRDRPNAQWVSENEVGENYAKRLAAYGLQHSVLPSWNRTLENLSKNTIMVLVEPDLELIKYDYEETGERWPYVRYQLMPTGERYIRVWGKRLRIKTAPTPVAVA